MNLFRCNNYLFIPGEDIALLLQRIAYCIGESDENENTRIPLMNLYEHLSRLSTEYRCSAFGVVHLILIR